MRLFLYEYACAQPASVPLPDSVRREGRAMFDAVLYDASQLEPSIEVVSIPEHSSLSTQHYFTQSDYALIIAPEFDGILERLAREALEAGCKLLGPLPEAIRLTGDKWELYQHWRSRKVPTPETWLPPHLPSEAGRYIQKHRWGAGSLGAKWWSLGEKVPEDHLVLRFDRGVPGSVSLLISPTGQVTPLLPAFQMFHNNGMFSYKGGSFMNDVGECDRVIQLARKAVQGIPGLHGYVGVDVMLGKNENGSEDVVLEINPRLTTSYLGLRQATSLNLIHCMLEVVNCDRIVPINWVPQGIRWSC